MILAKGIWGRRRISGQRVPFWWVQVARAWFGALVGLRPCTNTILEYSQQGGACHSGFLSQGSLLNRCIADVGSFQDLNSCLNRRRLVRHGEIMGRCSLTIPKDNASVNQVNKLCTRGSLTDFDASQKLKRGYKLPRAKVGVFDFIRRKASGALCRCSKR